MTTVRSNVASGLKSRQGGWMPRLALPLLAVIAIVCLAGCATPKGALLVPSVNCPKPPALSLPEPYPPGHFTTPYSTLAEAYEKLLDAAEMPRN